jgi:hypothetical protein
MDRNTLISAGPTYTYLRGLLAVPIGAAFLLAGATFLEWGPFGNQWLFWGGVLACLAAGAVADRYYRQNYGRVTPPRESRVKDALWTVFGVVALIGFAVLDSVLELPVNGYVLAYALMMFGYIATSIGLKVRHVTVWGALLLAALLPVWSGVDEVAAGLFPMGVATVIGGLLDHSAFVANLGPSRVPVGNGNAGA